VYDCEPVDDVAFRVRIISATATTLTLSYQATPQALPSEPIGCTCPGGPFEPPAPTPVPPPKPSLIVTSNGQTVAQVTPPPPPSPSSPVPPATAWGSCNPNQALFIDNTPAMPPLQVTIVMSDGSRPTGTATFSVWGSFPQTNLNTSYPPNGTFLIPWAYWNGLPAASQPTPQSASDTWTAGWSTPVGGGNASIQWDYNGAPQQPFNFCILANNPDESAVTAVLAPSNPAYWYQYWFANYISIHETNQSQFCDTGDPSRTNGADYCRNGGTSGESGPYPGRPIWGFPFGYGAMQVDPPPTSYTLWNWYQNLLDGIAQLQAKAGQPSDVAAQGAQNSTAYAFWNGQVQQWNDENLALQAQTPPQPTFPTPESVDPGPNRANNCHFIGSLDAATGISTPNTGLPYTYWYGDAILMRMNAGTIDACGHNANYISWINSKPGTPGRWAFDKTTTINSDIVYEFCTCTSFSACVRLPKPTCQ